MSNTTDYRPLGDRETILPGDVCRVPDGSGWVIKEGFSGSAYRTPAELNVDAGDRWYSRPIPRPAPAAPRVTVTLEDGWRQDPGPGPLPAEPEPPQPEPVIDPGDRWRLLGDDEVIEAGDQALTSRFGWATISLAEGLTRSESLWAAVRRRDPLTPAAIHRAAITDNTHDDVLPAMRYGVNCVDGVRRYAASYGEACRVFDEAARATLAKRGGQS